MCSMPQHACNVGQYYAVMQFDTPAVRVCADTTSSMRVVLLAVYNVHCKRSNVHDDDKWIFKD
jgi:hypothetical protein